LAASIVISIGAVEVDGVVVSATEKRAVVTSSRVARKRGVHMMVAEVESRDVNQNASIVCEILAASKLRVV
jgi:hypothetical protein